MEKRENAGYKIIRSECYYIEDNNKYEVVLGVMYGNGYEKYVTWECKNENDYFWGHYFSKKNVALIDYHKRLLHYYEEILK